jgi:hypothetical protein
MVNKRSELPNAPTHMFHQVVDAGIWVQGLV